MQQAREECEMVQDALNQTNEEKIFTSCIDELLKRTNLKPSDIDILIANCSLFNPTPSITSMIINKYKVHWKGSYCLLLYR